jgi:hypothetical protein
MQKDVRAREKGRKAGKSWLGHGWALRIARQACICASYNQPVQGRPAVALVELGTTWPAVEVLDSRYAFNHLGSLILASAHRGTPEVTIARMMIINRQQSQKDA